MREILRGFIRQLDVECRVYLVRPSLDQLSDVCGGKANEDNCYTNSAEETDTNIVYSLVVMYNKVRILQSRVVSDSILNSRLVCKTRVLFF